MQSPYKTHAQHIYH